MNTLTIVFFFFFFGMAVLRININCISLEWLPNISIVRSENPLEGEKNDWNFSLLNIIQLLSGRCADKVLLSTTT